MATYISDPETTAADLHHVMGLTPPAAHTSVGRTHGDDRVDERVRDTEARLVTVDVRGSENSASQSI